MLPKLTNVNGNKVPIADAYDIDLKKIALKAATQEKQQEKALQSERKKSSATKSATIFVLQGFFVFSIMATLAFILLQVLFLKHGFQMAQVSFSYSAAEKLLSAINYFGQSKIGLVGSFAPWQKIVEGLVHQIEYDNIYKSRNITPPADEIPPLELVLAGAMSVWDLHRCCNIQLIAFFDTNLTLRYGINSKSTKEETGSLYNTNIGTEEFPFYWVDYDYSNWENFTYSMFNTSAGAEKKIYEQTFPEVLKNIPPPSSSTDSTSTTNPWEQYFKYYYPNPNKPISPVDIYDSIHFGIFADVSGTYFFWTGPLVRGFDLSSNVMCTKHLNGSDTELIGWIMFATQFDETLYFNWANEINACLTLREPTIDEPLHNLTKDFVDFNNNEKKQYWDVQDSPSLFSLTPSLYSTAKNIEKSDNIQDYRRRICPSSTSPSDIVPITVDGSSIYVKFQSANHLADGPIFRLDENRGTDKQGNSLILIMQLVTVAFSICFGTVLGIMTKKRISDRTNLLLSQVEKVERKSVEDSQANSQVLPGSTSNSKLAQSESIPTLNNNINKTQGGNLKLKIDGGGGGGGDDEFHIGLEGKDELAMLSNILSLTLEELHEMDSVLTLTKLELRELLKMTMPKKLFDKMMLSRFNNAVVKTKEEVEAEAEAEKEINTPKSRKQSIFPSFMSNKQESNKPVKSIASAKEEVPIANRNSDKDNGGKIEFAETINIGNNDDDGEDKNNNTSNHNKDNTESNQDKSGKGKKSYEFLESIKSATAIFIEIEWIKPDDSNDSEAFLKSVNLLSDLVGLIEHLCQHYNVLKIKTIGNILLAVSNCVEKNEMHVDSAVKMAIALQSVFGKSKTLADFGIPQPSMIKNIESLPCVEVKIGIAEGPLTAGIIGVASLSYDVYGNTVNTASRLESNSKYGEIRISQQVYDKLNPKFRSHFYESDVVAKGLGSIQTYVKARSTQIKTSAMLLNNVEKAVSNGSSNVEYGHDHNGGMTEIEDLFKKGELLKSHEVTSNASLNINSKNLGKATEDVEIKQKEMELMRVIKSLRGFSKVKTRNSLMFNYLLVYLPLVGILCAAVLTYFFMTLSITSTTLEKQAGEIQSMSVLSNIVGITDGLNSFLATYLAWSYLWVMFENAINAPTFADTQDMVNAYMNNQFVACVGKIGGIELNIILDHNRNLIAFRNYDLATSQSLPYPKAFETFNTSEYDRFFMPMTSDGNSSSTPWANSTELSLIVTNAIVVSKEDNSVYLLAIGPLSPFGYFIFGHRISTLNQISVLTRSTLCCITFSQFNSIASSSSSTSSAASYNSMDMLQFSKDARYSGTSLVEYLSNFKGHQAGVYSSTSGTKKLTSSSRSSSSSSSDSNQSENRYCSSSSSLKTNDTNVNARLVKSSPNDKIREIDYLFFADSRFPNSLEHGFYIRVDFDRTVGSILQPLFVAVVVTCVVISVFYVLVSLTLLKIKVFSRVNRFGESLTQIAQQSRNWVRHRTTTASETGTDIDTVTSISLTMKSQNSGMISYGSKEQCQEMVNELFSQCTKFFNRVYLKFSDRTNMKLIRYNTDVNELDMFRSSKSFSVAVSSNHRDSAENELDQLMQTITEFENEIKGGGEDELWLLSVKLGSKLRKFINGMNDNMEQETMMKTCLQIIMPVLSNDDDVHNWKYRLGKQRNGFDFFPDCSVFVLDVANFTKTSSTRDSKVIASFLARLWSKIEKLCDEYSIVKIKTVGDAFQAIAGTSSSATDNRESVCDMVMFGCCVMNEFKKNGHKMFQMKKEEFKEMQDSTGVNLRIGIHTGDVFGSVLGYHQISYNIWGNGYARASKMESSSKTGHVLISKETYNILQEQNEGQPSKNFKRFLFTHAPEKEGYFVQFAAEQ